MPEDPLDPIEALELIRVHIDAASETAEGTALAGTFREIRAVLDRAMPVKAGRARRGKAPPQTGEG